MKAFFLCVDRFSAQLIPEVPVAVNEVAEHAVKQKIHEGLFFFPPESQKTLTELTALNTHTEPSCKIIWLVSNCSSAQDAQCQTSVANISPTPADVVIVIRRCVCGAPVRCPALAHARRDTQTCTVNTSRINPWLANNSNSKQIRVRVCVCVLSPQQHQVHSSHRLGHASYCNDGELMSVGCWGCFQSLGQQGLDYR